MIDFGLEMGIDHQEILDMTWREYDYRSIGYLRRVERGMDQVRHLVAGMYNSSGMIKKPVRARDIMELPLLDGRGEIRRVPEEKLKRMLKILQQ